MVKGMPAIQAILLDYLFGFSRLLLYVQSVVVHKLINQSFICMYLVETLFYTQFFANQ